MKTNFLIRTPEGTCSGDVAGGLDGPGNAFRRLLFEGREGMKYDFEIYANPEKAREILACYKRTVKLRQETRAKLQHPFNSRTGKPLAAGTIKQYEADLKRRDKYIAKEKNAIQMLIFFGFLGTDSPEKEQRREYITKLIEVRTEVQDLKRTLSHSKKRVKEWKFLVESAIKAAKSANKSAEYWAKRAGIEIGKRLRSSGDNLNPVRQEKRARRTVHGLKVIPGGLTP